jgi:hypothetical protein
MQLSKPPKPKATRKRLKKEILSDDFKKRKIFWKNTAENFHMQNFPPHITMYEHGEPWWNNTDRGNPKSCHSATSSTTNPTWRDSGANPCLRRERLATNRLSHRHGYKTGPKAVKISVVKLQVHMASSMKLTAFWNTALCSLVECNRRVRRVQNY